MQALRRGLVDGTTLYTDATHLKADANKNKFIKKQVKKSTCRYLAELEHDINRDRAAHGKKPMKPDASEPEVKEIKISTTDPESGYMVRDGKPEGFFYLDHRTVDAKNNIITDAHVTPASLHDSVPYLDRLDRQRERFGFDVKAVGLDAGYFTPAICKGLEDREVFGAIAYRTPNHKKGYFYKKDFVYDRELDCYRCPGGQALEYSTTNRNGYREYKSDPNKCRVCQRLMQCTQSSNNTKVVTRHVWEDSKERVNQNRLTERGKKIYKRRKETVERSFADSKQLHGHRYARMRGLKKALEQALLCAAVQNMKKIALILTGQNKKGVRSPQNPSLNPFIAAMRGLVALAQNIRFRPNYACHSIPL